MYVVRQLALLKRLDFGFCEVVVFQTYEAVPDGVVVAAAVAFELASMDRDGGQLLLEFCLALLIIGSSSI